jgi:hypothetical protein
MSGGGKTNPVRGDSGSMSPPRSVDRLSSAAAMFALTLVVAMTAGCALRGSPDASGGAAGSSTPDAGDARKVKPDAPPVTAAPSPAAPMPARLAQAKTGVAGAAKQCLVEIESFAERHTANRVMLGEAAFASSDRLVLTRAAHRASDGRPLDGRAAMPQPVVLNLLAGPDGCSVRLADAADGAAAAGSSAPLPACTCVPLP